MNGDWKAELRDRVRDAAGLEIFLGAALPTGLAATLEAIETRGLQPFAAPKCFLALARLPLGEEPYSSDPILAQALPSASELEAKTNELDDPLGEMRYSCGSRLVRQYRSRLLIRATGECLLYCRHCYRRNLLPEERGFMDCGAMDDAAGLLERDSSIREVLVSGGDPLTADEGRLDELFGRLRAARPGIAIRVCTRAPVCLPSRVTEELIGLLRSYRPLRIVIQANHPRELGQSCAEALGALLDSGIGVRTQTVLLRGVNDDTDTLEELFARLTSIGADPYYLFQGDLAAGTSHFRVPLSRGLALYAELRDRLSGLELPRYAVDSPGGGGKVFLPEGILGQREGGWALAARDGSEGFYPEEDCGTFP